MRRMRRQERDAREEVSGLSPERGTPLNCHQNETATHQLVTQPKLRPFGNIINFTIGRSSQIPLIEISA